MYARKNAAQVAVQAEPCPNGAGGYSNDQLRLFLEQLASQAAALNQILMMAQRCYEQSEKDCLVNAAQAMAQSIGSIADHATGESVIGGIGRWHCGPNFAQAGGAA